MDVLTFIPIHFLEGISLALITYNISKPKFPFKKLLIIAFICMIADIIGDLTIQDINLPLVLIASCAYLYKLTSKFKIALWLDIVSLLLLMFTDIITYILMVYIFKIPYTSSDTSFAANLLAVTLYIILGYGLSLGFKKVSNRIKKHKWFSFINNNKIILIYIIFTLFSLYITTIIFRPTLDTHQTRFILWILLVIGCFIASIAMLYINNKNIKQQIELENTKSYTLLVESVNNDLQKFRHDFNNILQSINSYVETKNYDKLKILLDKHIIPDTKKLEFSEITSSLNDIKIDAIKGLLSSKCTLAYNNQLECKLSVQQEILSNDIKINIIDMCRILGILLDNAIEACEQCTNQKQIIIDISKTTNSIQIEISNTTIDNHIDINKIFDNGISSKGEGRGIGLSFVKDCEKKYKNLTINTTINTCCPIESYNTYISNDNSSNNLQSPLLFTQQLILRK